MPYPTGARLDPGPPGTPPALSVRQLTVGTLSFQMGGYLAIAIGGAFLLLGDHLPRTFHLYWAVVLLALVLGPHRLNQLG